MNWVMSLVDVAIYPVLAVTYLSFWVPQLTDGGWGMPGWVVQWLAAIAIILVISLLQIRGARLAGMTSVWIGVILLIPIVIMTVLGFYNWGAHGSSFEMSFLPKDTSIWGAFSVGLVRGHVELHGLGVAHLGRRRDRQAQAHLSPGHAAGAHRRHRHLRSSRRWPPCTAVRGEDNKVMLVGSRRRGRHRTGAGRRGHDAGADGRGRGRSRRPPKAGGCRTSPRR